MKKIFLVVLVSMAFMSFTTSVNVEANKENVECSTTTSSTVTQNPDGSSTRTTTTSISCDTPEELAQLHALMRAIGMGV